MKVAVPTPLPRSSVRSPPAAKLAALLIVAVGCGFTPSGVAAATGTTTMSAGQGGGSTTTEPGTVELDPTHVDFGPTPFVVGSPPPPDVGIDTIQVRAVGGPVDRISASAPKPFEATTDCPPTLLNGESCVVTIRIVAFEDGSFAEPLEVDFRGGSTFALLTADMYESNGWYITLPMTGTPLVVPDKFEQCDARAGGASIRYFPKQTMVVGETKSIEVTASVATPLGDVFTETAEGEVVVKQPLKCTVRARLVGGDEFHISPEDWERKNFEERNEVDWSWKVTPLKEGEDIPLQVEVQGVKFDETTQEWEQAGDDFSIEALIEVDSAPEGFWTRLNGAITGVVKHPVVATLLSTGAIAFMVSWAVRRFKGRGSSSSDGDSEPVDAAADR